MCQQLDGDTCGAAQQEEHVVGTVNGPGKATSTAEGGCTSGCTSGWCTRCDSVAGAVILGHTPLGVPTMCFCVGDRRLRVSIHAVHAAAHGICRTSGSRHAVLVCAPTPAAAAAASAGGSTAGPTGARDMDSQRLELAVVSQDGGGGSDGDGDGDGDGVVASLLAALAAAAIAPTASCQCVPTPSAGEVPPPVRGPRACTAARGSAKRPRDDETPAASGSGDGGAPRAGNTGSSASASAGAGASASAGAGNSRLPKAERRRRIRLRLSSSAFYGGSRVPGTFRTMPRGQPRQPVSATCAPPVSGPPSKQQQHRNQPASPPRKVLRPLSAGQLFVMTREREIARHCRSRRRLTGLDVYESFPTQAQAFARCDDLRSQGQAPDASPRELKVFSVEQRGAEASRRFVVADRDEFWRRYMRTPPARRHVYEIIREGELWRWLALVP